MENPILWSLIAIQVAMGAFDTLVHHETTERLAWRASQKQELRLHSVRNGFYALIFLTFAWLEPHGVFTMILAAILAFEVGITLWDFVEEDLTRRLPATERINHTLLALNYGAILAFAAPVLWDWAFLPSALIPVSYGYWSLFATLSALGVAVFALRDFAAANRSDRLALPEASGLVEALPPRQSVLVTGGTGFIGTRLTEALVAAGHDVTILTRSVRHAGDLSHPVRLITALEQIPSDTRFDTIINLAGESIAGGLWTARRKAKIIASRVETTRALANLVARLDHKPDCLINGSAVGFYGLHDDEPLAEDGAVNPAFVHDVCAAWEQETAPIEAMGLRVVRLRIGVVMGVDGGMLAKLLTPFEFGLGGRMGHGQQWLPWIERDDLVHAIAFAIATPSLQGPVNAVAPEPARNVDFAKALGAALGRPAVIPVPGWLISGGLGDLGRETMLGGQRVIPRALEEAGFAFRYPSLAPALKAITGATEARAASVAKAGVQTT